MKAKDIMTTKVVSVRRDTPVNEIATLLLDRHISGVPVTDAEGHVLGVVTEGDLIQRAEAPPRRSWWLAFFSDADVMAREFVKSHGLKAWDVMTKEVLTVTEDTSLADIARLLEEKRIKRVPVVRDGHLVGIVSRADVIRALAARGVEPAPPEAKEDETIRKQLLEALRREPWADTHLLNIVVDRGIVHIWGLVRSPNERRALRVAAENIPAVRHVSDHTVLWEDVPPGV
ncbi:MAG: CBS domain-containing protein [Candidatus Methylomirabilia bacterium]